MKELKVQIDLQREFEYTFDDLIINSFSLAVSSCPLGYSMIYLGACYNYHNCWQ